MATLPASTAAAPTFTTPRKDWRAAFTALRGLLADANDTAQVFRIMRALNADTAARGYARLLASAEGGRIAYAHAELAERFADPAFVAGFAPGTLGAAYAEFLARTGYSAEGLAQVSRTDDDSREAPHPYAWFARRTRDTHDVWHLLTGYAADDPLGEACLTAFSYAQTGGLGWAAIALGSALQARGEKGVAKAIWEGYRRGKNARWLLGEDYEAMFAEPLEAARARLGIGPAPRYEAVK
jgi:ubiquinone biosynthesis protein COQ4